MPFNGPRFAPRGGPMQNNPRFKQFPPQMQPRMHYGPRQPMRPRQPMPNNFNQTRPQNNQVIKPDSPASKPIENVNAPDIKQEPKTPQTQKVIPKVEMKTPTPVPSKQDETKTNAGPIKVVTSTTNVSEPKIPPTNTALTNKPKTTPIALHEVNTNGVYLNPPKDNQYSTQSQQKDNAYTTQQKDNAYTTQQKDNQYSTQQKDNQYSTQQRENQYSTQQRDNQYSSQQRDSQYPNQQRDNQYSYQQKDNYYSPNDGRMNEQGNRMRPPGRQDYGKMGDKLNKPYYSNDRVRDRVRMIAGPQLDLPPLDMSEKKFNSYGRLFVGNLQKNVTQEDLQIVFSKYGEIGQIYVNKEASYAFINFDFKANALKAMRELDNTLIKGRAIKVRIAAISDGIRVKNLSQTVSNELLERAFSVFGNVESCKVIVDDRGMTTGEGTVIFKDKKTAYLAAKKCQDECFILSGTARPVVVAPIEQSETNEEGLPEASLMKNEDYMRERSVGPHFADEASFEFELGEEWKKVYLVHEERKKALELEFHYDKERIEKKLVLARVEFEKEKLRKELAAREAESAHLRRHFDADSVSANKTYPEGNEAMQYESYGSSKRPADTTYDTAYAGAYDPAYKDSYDRAYGRDYDRGYGREFDRAGGYGGYNREGAYDRGYEAAPAAELPPHELADRAKYEIPPLEFDMTEGYPGYDRTAAPDAYKTNKRPRY